MLKIKMKLNYYERTKQAQCTGLIIPFKRISVICRISKLLLVFVCAGFNVSSVWHYARLFKFGESAVELFQNSLRTKFLTAVKK